MPGKAVVVIATLAILLLGIGAVATQYQVTVEESQPLQTVENETFTPSEGNTTVLSESNRDVVYNESVDVYQNDTEWTADGNYTWNGGTGSGTLFVVNGTGLNTSEQASITYGYHVPSSGQEITRDVGSLPFELTGELVIILIGMLLLLALAVLLAGGGY